MCTSPVCNFATLLFATQEGKIMPSHPNIIFYKQYINNVYGIWVLSTDATNNTANWLRFQTDMQSFYGVRWTFKPLYPTINFLDITVHIKNGVISTTIFKKALNLYLSISAHSCNRHGMITGLVLENYHRIYTLYTD